MSLAGANGRNLDVDRPTLSEAKHVQQGKDAQEANVFDFSGYPEDTLFHDRRSGPAGSIAKKASQAESRKPRPERRKRIDPTTFEKQYTPEELEFMSAMQQFKVQSGKTFPSHGEVLRVAEKLGYRKVDEETT